MFDLDDYRVRAEEFTEELSREYYLHLAGHKAELEIESIYDAHSGLFEVDAVESLRGLAASANREEGRRLRYLLHFAFDGLVGQETKREVAELAGLEASLEVDPGDGPVPYRAVPIEQANEPDPDRRASLQDARDAVLDERLNPLHRATLERAHELCGRFGWASYAAAYSELRGVDLEELVGQTARFLAATDDRYEPALAGRLERTGVPPLGELRRSDLPRFFRAADLDAMFPAEGLIPTFERAVAGLGVEIAGQGNVHLDTEPRPTKSPRAFCSVPKAPDEVYLVIAPTGGRDDYVTLFHEGGHTEHYANVDPALPFEFRHLGDNSVTESFAFLLEHLVEDGAWLSENLDADEVGDALAQARAYRILILRRYSAKLAYELELHGPSPRFDELPGRYTELLTRALRVPWPRVGWLADVDDGFYAACYLRAWALEGRWWEALRERFGERWYVSADAGAWLRELWRSGQRLDAAELVSEHLGGELDFAELARTT